MADFARLDKNNFVSEIFYVDDSKCIDSKGRISEQSGINFCKKIFGKNNKFVLILREIKGEFPRIGYFYSTKYNKFIAPQPYTSWVFDFSSGRWTSPLGNSPETKPCCEFCYWSEEEYQKDNTKGWIIVKSEEKISEEKFKPNRENFLYPEELIFYEKPIMFKLFKKLFKYFSNK
jgi:hypothetical protein